MPCAADLLATCLPGQYAGEPVHTRCHAAHLLTGRLPVSNLLCTPLAPEPARYPGYCLEPLESGPPESRNEGSGARQPSLLRNTVPILARRPAGRWKLMLPDDGEQNGSCSFAALTEPA